MHWKKYLAGCKLTYASFFLGRAVIFTAKIDMNDVYGLVILHAMRK